MFHQMTEDILVLDLPPMDIVRFASID